MRGVLPEQWQGHPMRCPSLCWPVNSAQRLWELVPCGWSLVLLLDQPACHTCLRARLAPTCSLQ